jgi:hydroxymethylpyrimidine pyrophosphatase-like HAD family hydrolase
MKKKKCIIIDIDGTLMDISKRVAANRPFIVKEEDLNFYDLDETKPQTAKVVEMFANDGYDIIFCSGRTEIGRIQTAKQIINSVSLTGSGTQLFMRADGDQRGDDVVKSEMLTKIQETHDVFLVLDDRDRVVNFWRSIGLVCWQVAPGNF